MLRYCEFSPAPDVRSVAERYWFLEGADAGAGPILPDGHPELVVHLGNRPLAAGVRQAACLFVGQMRTAMVLEMSGAVSAWGIRFHPHAGRLVTGGGIEQWRLAGSIHEAEGVDGLREALGNASDARGRVAITDAWVRRRVAGQAGTSMVAGAALGMLPGMSVERVAGRLGYTRRHLERVFAAEVGLSPKAWARIARLQAALRAREVHPEWSWADVAAAAGYADQPHMALEFREIAGSAPTRLLPAVLSHSSKSGDVRAE